MNREQVAVLLARIRAFDGRQLTDEMVEAWHGLFAGTAVDYPAAVRAVEKHYTVETRRIMPADIISRVDPFAGTRWATMRSEEQRRIEAAKPELEA